ncbi:hypothetical protein AVEN_77076-1 [Araneus ventricosus]|uniref:Uncharacterized protein n=1 Tax=Araneus ventricosus TaxID=182803 RepID=A0A4Y1ZTX8_ARAVE|nr:hypothetical protein AVEN_77076-1 [Araneus ventricosus]
MSLGGCKCICGFQRCGGKYLRHQRARRCQFIPSLKHCGDICQVTRSRNGASVRIPPTSVHKCEPRATRSVAKPHAVGTARLFEFHRPHSTNVNLERLEDWPSHTPLLQGFRG